VAEKDFSAALALQVSRLQHGAIVAETSAWG